MNPLAFTKCAARLLMALAAIAGLFLMAGCGSSSSLIKTLGGGFSTSSLKGQYVVRQTGFAVNSAGTSVDSFSEVTVLTADGSGNLTILEDDFDQDGVQSTGSDTGTYTVNNDGTGSAAFKTIGTTYAITMIDDRHFYVIETDAGVATSSGYGQLQDTTAFAAAPSGTFVFKAHNVQTTSRVGGITIAGGVISGTEDLLDLGRLSNNQAINSATPMSTPDSTIGRGTFTLTDGSSFGYYVVSASEFYFMSNTTTDEIGQAQLQTGGPFSLATLASGNAYVFGSAGDTTISGPAGIHSAGVFKPDGNGNITGGEVDYVQDTTVNSGDAVTGGQYTLASNGRGQVNLTLSSNTISPQIFWMVDANDAYFLVNSTAAVEDGTFTLQVPAPALSAQGQSALVMDGFDTTLKDRVGVFADTSSTAFNWNQVANAFDPTSGTGQITTIGTTGTFSAADSNGRVAVTVNNVSSALAFYLSSNNSGFMVQEDANIGGAFASQASQ